MWKIVKLEEIARPVGGSGFPKKYQGDTEGEIPFFKVSDMNLPKNEKFMSSANNYVSRETLKFMKGKAYPAGTIIFPKIGGAISTNKKRILARESAFDNNVMGLVPNEEISSEYLYKFFLNLDLYEISNKAALPSITATAVKEIEVPLPPLAEQQRIVAKLDAAFAEIDRAVEIGQVRLSRTAKAFGQIVDIELSKLRENHESCSLGEMLDSVEYGTSTKCLKNGKYPVLRMGNIQAGSFTMDDLVYLNSDEEFEKYRVRKGDVFFNRTNSALHVGKSAIYEGEEDCLFAGYLIRLNHSESLLDGRFLNHYLNAPSTRAYGYSVMTSSVNQSNINGTKVKEYPFFEVDLETQRCIRRKLDDVTSLLSQAQFALEKSLNEYAQLKSAILAQELQPPQNEAA